jgi:hypothetical protein
MYENVGLNKVTGKIEVVSELANFYSPLYMDNNGEFTELKPEKGVLLNAIYVGNNKYTLIGVELGEVKDG